MQTCLQQETPTRFAGVSATFFFLIYIMVDNIGLGYNKLFVSRKAKES